VGLSLLNDMVGQMPRPAGFDRSGGALNGEAEV